MESCRHGVIGAERRILSHASGRAGAPIVPHRGEPRRAAVHPTKIPAERGGPMGRMWRVAAIASLLAILVIPPGSRATDAQSAAIMPGLDRADGPLALFPNDPWCAEGEPE